MGEQGVERARRGDGALRGLGNAFESEAIAGALPVGQNSPQRTPLGLYAEQLSGTAFTAPRAENRRTWVYRLRPSADHGPLRPVEAPPPRWETGPFAEPPDPNRLRWGPLPPPASPRGFLDAVFTMAGAGSPEAQEGVALHRYAFDRSMRDEAFFNADAEMVFLPESGPLRLVTELGVLEVPPDFVALIPAGMRLRVELREEGQLARGYLCENYGRPFALPELGPIGANGLANPHDFESPPAAFEREARPTRLVQKFAGRFWETELRRSPFDVVAWRGNLVPYRYDLRRFNVINTVSFDHPDPSIFTVLTSPSGRPGTANCDFVIFPPRWMVAEHTFRPPWYHRNVMSEWMGLVRGVYDAKAEGFAPGGVSLHNAHGAHGPDRETYERAVSAELVPERYANTLAFMFETRLPLRTPRSARECATRQLDYDTCWNGFEMARLPEDASVLAPGAEEETS